MWRYDKEGVMPGKFGDFGCVLVEELCEKKSIWIMEGEDFNGKWGI